MKKSKHTTLLRGNEDGYWWKVDLVISDIGKFMYKGKIKYKNSKDDLYSKQWRCDNKNWTKEYDKTYRKQNPIKKLYLGFYYEDGFGISLNQDISKEGKIYGMGSFVVTMTPKRRKIMDFIRRERDVILLNDYFSKSELHHLNNEYGIYIPKELHRSIFHNMKTGKNMKMINDKALRYLDLNTNRNKEANCFR